MKTVCVMELNHEVARKPALLFRSNSSPPQQQLLLANLKPQIWHHEVSLLQFSQAHVDIALRTFSSKHNVRASGHIRLSALPSVNSYTRASNEATTTETVNKTALRERVQELEGASETKKKELDAAKQVHDKDHQTQVNFKPTGKHRMPQNSTPNPRRPP
ncbi:hypothetical protein BU25DRAFT_424335 [Macroventuria anomochaeta]|uniref:Uncharacterized protein n=1 Tax=Macroventuria anomochaeta TaxID=301207 RepID=A0ACB6RR21_9PLEO|nr:uncharacterized protein BU25DRAFT_424335 [Macroventuria anomochaeta]KAF2624258.1 hypothetical protein BU25DRAFT_424335 [Macroventuria anomochaeta]